ncbi:MAG: sigma-70 family RNA polymerase sigma factor [Planctomycetaceae bacterium]
MTVSAKKLQESVLVVRCQAGDETAFRQLVESYSPRLRYFLRKLAPDADRIEDLLQDVWLDAFRALPRLIEVAAFPAWIYRIARSHVAAEYRRRGLESKLMEQLTVGQMPQETPIPEFSPEDAQRIHHALDNLPTMHREVLVLRFLEDLSYDDMAAVLGCPVGTVRSRIYYAKLALRQFLES